ncbi:MAG: VirB3 family type IV secretion system protein [Rickettsiaceae bacterium]|nr:VirB3 family type IV secretion system protein [Rickettsiaceae bacterium]
MGSGQLTVDPLFVGLTRPPMLFGVSIIYAMLNMMISVLAFINLNSFKVIPFAVVIHFIGYIACFKEPRFMELYMIKSSKCPSVSNRSYYGLNSYSV